MGVFQRRDRLSISGLAWRRRSCDVRRRRHWLKPSSLGTSGPLDAEARDRACRGSSGVLFAGAPSRGGPVWGSEDGRGRWRASNTREASLRVGLGAVVVEVAKSVRDFEVFRQAFLRHSLRCDGRAKFAWWGRK